MTESYLSAFAMIHVHSRLFAGCFLKNNKIQKIPHNFTGFLLGSPMTSLVPTHGQFIVEEVEL
jgi:hypothetical protein